MRLFLTVSLALLVLDNPSTVANELAEGTQGMVVAVSPEAVDIGVHTLKAGGSSVDAAVAVAFAMAVTYPQAGNIGGGGFMLIHPPKSGKPIVIDYREKAPLKATAEMFVKDPNRHSHRASGVPGTVRGLEMAHRLYGKLPWKDLVLPAVKLAEEGIVLNRHLTRSLNGILKSSPKHAELQRVFGKKNGKAPWQIGDWLKQPDLAKTLRLIANRGADAFYKGAIADLLVKEMKQGKGLITHKDLAQYKAVMRKPIHGTYRGFDIYGPPPPSSGGICLVEMLNILENFDLKEKGRWSPETLHLMIEAMRRAYADRARHLGDGDFVKIPAHLTTKEYAKKLAKHIDLKKATPSAKVAPEIKIFQEGTNTTHFSIIDKEGLAVSNTYTLEQSYGSRVVVRGAGFLLNNEMFDFNWRPGKTTTSGSIGTKANRIEPGKRMLSSQTPSIVARNGKVVLITGSPGGRTIINTVLCVVLNVIEFEMSIDKAVTAPRLHHAWFPDVANFEGIAKHPQTIETMRMMGHRVRNTRSQGDAHSIWIDPKTGNYFGAADPRIIGKAAGY